MLQFLKKVVSWGKRHMANIKIAVFNSSTVCTDAEVEAMCKAMQIQVTRDFAPIWGIDAIIEFCPQGVNPPAGAWQVGLFDTADQAGALGYHELTPEGLPMGKVFAKTTIDNGGKVSVTLSHEILEMLPDPDVNLVATVDQPHGLRLYAFEDCDAVEDDSLGYDINGITVSDFVTPAWFQSFRKPGSTAFSFRGSVDAPFKLAKGGYISYLDAKSTAGWQQETHAERRVDHKSENSRKHKRHEGKSAWKTSTAKR